MTEETNDTSDITFSIRDITDALLRGFAEKMNAAIREALEKQGLSLDGAIAAAKDGVAHIEIDGNFTILVYKGKRLLKWTQPVIEQQDFKFTYIWMVQEIP